MYFQDDWLNEYYDLKQQQQQQQREHPPHTVAGADTDAAAAVGSAAAGPAAGDTTAAAAADSVMTCDYRFVYLGPAGSATPLHSGDRRGAGGGVLLLSMLLRLADSKQV